MKILSFSFIRLTLILALGIIGISAHAQCPPGDLTLLTQAEVDAFAVDYPGCTTISGNLTVGPSTDIVDLDGLSALTEVSSLSVIENAVLANTVGLNNLSFVGYQILIRNNPNVISLDFSNVSSIDFFQIEVIDNPSLIYLAAPENISTIGRHIIIQKNPALATFTGFDNLTYVRETISITETGAAAFPAFPNLNFIGYQILIRNNPNVTSLDFSAVSSIDFFQIEIINNPSLTNLAAPENIATIDRHIIINDNPALVTFTGFDAVTSVGETIGTTTTGAATFPAFPNLNFVGYQILIRNNPNVTSLDFSAVSSIDFFQIEIINNPSLTNLAAPENIATIDRHIIINDNPALVTFTGFDAVTSVGETIGITTTGAATFPAFPNLNFVGYQILIRNNPNVTSLDFSAVSSIDFFQIEIINNPSLTNLAAPENIATIDRHAIITGNPNLTTFTGFDALYSIGESLQIDDTQVLDFPGLGNLQLVPDLRLSRNTGITSLNWLSSLTLISNLLYIRDNAQLSFCAIQPVCSFLAGAGTRSITNNTGCCLDEPVLTDACDNVSSGTEEICDGEDNDCDGLIDEGFDQDGDGVTTCGGDCDDNDPNNYPGNEEVCDAADNNCDGQIDEGFDSDNDGFTSCGGDCDDNDPNNYPGNEEVCDGADNNCDGQIDEGFDLDNDGFTSCNGDCDDNDPNNYPGNEEICDGADNNCDGQIDEGFDGDNDGIADCFDNCPSSPNPDQADSDCDGVGDACDQWHGCDDSLDSDNDGIPDCVDLDELDNWTCSNNGKKTYICHIPSGNPANQHTICISKNAVSTHLNNHGDYIGECYQIACSGSNLSAPAGYTESSYSFSDEIVLYPNPTSGFISLDVHQYLEQKVSLTIYNQMGQEVMSLSQQEIHTPVLQLDLAPQLPDGVYLLAIKTDEARFLKQFVLSRGK